MIGSCLLCYQAFSLSNSRDFEARLVFYLRNAACIIHWIRTIKICFIKSVFNEQKQGDYWSCFIGAAHSPRKIVNNNKKVFT